MAKRRPSWGGPPLRCLGWIVVRDRGLGDGDRTGAREGPLSPGPSPPRSGRKGRIRSRFGTHRTAPAGAPPPAPPRSFLTERGEFISLRQMPTLAAGTRSDTPQAPAHTGEPPAREGGLRVVVAANSFALACRTTPRRPTNESPAGGFACGASWIDHLPAALTHSRTHALTHSRTHALTHSRTHALTQRRPLPARSGRRSGARRRRWRRGAARRGRRSPPRSPAEPPRAGRAPASGSRPRPWC